MSFYNVEIHHGPNKDYPNIEENAVIVETTARGLPANNDRYATDYLEKTRSEFPSLERFRKYLVREKFDVDTDNIANRIAQIGGWALIATTGAAYAFNIELPTATSMSQDFIRLGSLLGGNVIVGWSLTTRKLIEREKPKIDATVEEFNRVFPHLKVTFSPRDYLATLGFPSIKLPFIGK